ncbi:MAG: NUDIX domain-containing protein [Bacteroidales bacterium]|nr:NUDIX domain-containing protein [Candidatus Cacconaster merdequi]
MANVYFDKDSIEVDDAVLPEFCRNFREINAGGGVVSDGKGNYLLILRHNVWDLPKGKQEPGEPIEACALREVSEETGLKNLSLKDFICTTHHTYKIAGQPCIKHTFWYNMEYTGSEALVPQTEEDITEAKWVAKEDLPQYLKETYPSIAEVVSHAGLL